MYSVENSYKASHYNVFGVIDKNHILANTFSKSILRTDSQAYKAAIHLLTNPFLIHKYIHTKLAKFLVENGFLIPDTFSELESLKKTHSIAMMGEASLGLAITTTLQCNFRCIYCYEGENLGSLHLSKHLELTILKLLEKVLPKKELFHVVWWGGEPLMRPDIIASLSERMIELCRMHKVRYLGSIVTNGSMLNRQNAQMLQKYHVKRIQVTLDGAKDSHDKRRISISGDATFDKIIENLKKNSHQFPNIILRINVDRRNYINASSLLDDLESLKDTIFLAPRPANDPHAKSRPDWLLSLAEFVEFEKEFYRHAYRKGFRVLIGYSDPGMTYCNAYQSQNSYCIDPFGGIHICPIFTGNKDERFGEISEDGDIIRAPTFENRESKLADTSFPFSDRNCISCKALPLCMGGCALYDSNESPPGFGDLRCTAKYNIAEKMYMARLWDFSPEKAVLIN